MGNSSVVGEANDDENSLVGLGEEPRPISGGMGEEKFPRTLLDCILVQHKDTLWAPNTERKHIRLLERFIGWYGKKGQVEGERKGREGTQDGETELKNLAKSMARYLAEQAQYASGENINGMGRIPMNLLGPWVLEEDKKSLEILRRVLRREANIANPPQIQAADAMRMEDLLELWKRSSKIKWGGKELMALEVLTIAFSSISRVAEILGLTGEM